jgi:TonB family protein
MAPSRSSISQFLFRASVIACLGVLVVTGVTAIGVRIQQRRQRTGVKQLRADEMLRQATETPLPAYPPVSLARGIEGVVVLRVQTDAVGEVREAEVLQAPDQLMGAAAQQSARHWKFANPSRSRLIGKVVLYFRIIAGAGVVALPVV